MNKMIAMAVAAAFAAPMAAQADVKLSGQLQQELGSWSGGACEASNMEGLHLDDGGQGCSTGAGGATAVGVSGSEDLGGGLKAVYKANFVLSVDENSGLGGRDAYVGLSGGFGTILAGRMNTPYKMATVKWDPMLATFAQARGNNGMHADMHNGYASNAIAYVNKFGGFKLAAAMVVDEMDNGIDGDGSTVGNHAYSISGNFAAGPVDVALAYHQQSEIGEDNGLSIQPIAVIPQCIIVETKPQGESPLGFSHRCTYEVFAWSLVPNLVDLLLNRLKGRSASTTHLALSA